MTEIFEVNCAICDEVTEVFDDDEHFNCPYCHEDNVLVDAGEVLEEEPDIVASIADSLTLNRSILDTWCSRHKEVTEHAWTTHPQKGIVLLCVVCWPSQMPKSPIRHVKEKA